MRASGSDERFRRGPAGHRLHGRVLFRRRVFTGGGASSGGAASSTVSLLADPPPQPTAAGASSAAPKIAARVIFATRRRIGFTPSTLAPQNGHAEDSFARTWRAQPGQGANCIA